MEPSQDNERWTTIPNLFTLARWPTAVLAIFMTEFLHWHPAIGAVTILIAGWTDAVDGWLARKLNQTSELGRQLDPTADKLYSVTVVAYLLAISLDNSTYLLLLSQIFGYEVAVAAYTIYVSRFRTPKYDPIPTEIGKKAFVFRMAGAGGILLLGAGVGGTTIHWLSLVFGYFGVAYGYLAVAQYVGQVRDNLSPTEQNRLALWPIGFDTWLARCARKLQLGGE